MLSVYNYMASGVLLTGIVAMLFIRGGMSIACHAQIMLGGGLLGYVVMLAPLGIVFAMSFGHEAHVERRRCRRCSGLTRR